MFWEDYSADEQAAYAYAVRGGIFMPPLVTAEEVTRLADTKVMRPMSKPLIPGVGVFKKREG
ncbi:MAG TPA: hypothetical protein VKU00_14675 [Chthonomonadaceae bacterium]|nr:hypothetical protein [Chthonomonadaceae bacterium]